MSAECVSLCMAFIATAETGQSASIRPVSLPVKKNGTKMSEAIQLTAYCAANGSPGAPFAILTKKVRMAIRIWRTDSLELMRSGTFEKAGERGVFFLAIALFVAGRLWRLTSYSLRPDEIFSIQVAQSATWMDMLNAVIGDVVHPPLFYAMLKVWLGLGGESEFWLRLLPVFTAVAAIGPFFLLCRELKLRAAEINLALTLFAVNAYLIYFAQELRMYSLLLFFTLCSLWLFVKLLNAAPSTTRPLMAL